MKHGTDGCYTNHKCRCQPCKDAHAAYQRRRNITTPAAIRNRRLINEAKKKPCIRCGNKFPLPAMDLHHRDREEKEFNVSELYNASEERINAELAKCDTICANCHRIITFGNGTEL